ncbi:MAG: type III pantothenate kinase [Oscillospiraceae bacterium]|nr:type III pantothenate kinase [Oscillospiraceae bacterium]
MVFAVDIGNTNIVIGCFSDNKISFVERVSTKPESTVLEYAITFKNIIEFYGIDKENIDGAIISSVVPSVTSTVHSAVKKAMGVDALVIGPGLKTGVNIVIDNPAQLGSDLVVDAAAGIAEYSLPLAIIDMGTATTVSVIDENRNYLGGMILPGVNISLNALASKTSQLPKISFDRPKKVIGSNTVDCMKSGILYGSASALDGIIERIEAEMGRKLTVVATGGLSGSIIPYCKHEIIHDDALLLKGLIVIYNKNK